MKKISCIYFFCFLFQFTCQGQGMYSLQNLQQSSPEVLNTYLTFANKQKKTGAFIIKTGLITVGAGIVVASATYDRDEWIGINTGTVIGGWMVILGTGATLVGLPILISGSTRIKRIDGIISQNSGSVNFEITPCCFQNFRTQKNQYGATLRIRF